MKDEPRSTMPIASMNSPLRNHSIQLYNTPSPACHIERNLSSRLYRVSQECVA